MGHPIHDAEGCLWFAATSDQKCRGMLSLFEIVVAATETIDIFWREKRLA
jgi:hypothetical protein